jgi:hypothetical protein
MKERKKKSYRVRKDLQIIDRSAVNSLDRRLEETLTLHGSGLSRESGISFKTAKTNFIDIVDGPH